MKKKICFVVSSAMTVNAFLQQPIRSLSEYYDVYIALNLKPGESLHGLEDLVTVLPVGIERKASPWRDLVTLWQLVRLFRLYRFNLIHSVTPKAGLLGMMAAFLSGVDIRIHTFTGQVWVTRCGLVRWMLKSIDRLIALLATRTLVDSASQRQFLLDEGVLDQAFSDVLAQGSISGVYVSRFKPDAEARSRIRNELRIPDDDTIFLFLGRLNRDKGVLDLASAFAGLDDGRTHLLVVGPDEGQLRQQIQQITSGCAERVHFVEFTTRPEEYMAASDVLCLPSYREGFGSVVIEAAAAGIPAIGSRIYGVVDAIAENYSGLLFEARDVFALRTCLSVLANDRPRRIQLGRQAYQRALAEFSSERLASAWLEFYQARL
ncbi:MAG: glycosyltransferase [Cellvibrio sp.]|uniref:glycosyltransferase n=1 Tax=Cellvibrio sp. TaxID=1965322 RepID=UPI00271ACBB8|nr:glycosyltransferase [Cellvibrio sp.]